jgi:ketosteroid isomerase-like protein
MSQENVEIVRRFDQAASRGDVEAFLLDMHPDIEFFPRRASMQGCYYGHQGIRQFFAENAENYEFFAVENEEFRDLGDRLLAFGTARVRGKGSGVEVETRTALVLTFREGKIIRFEDFGARSRALEAVGLSE